MVLDPDIAGYSVGSMMTKPASQYSRYDAATKFACWATLPRGSRSSSRRSLSSARSRSITSNTDAADRRRNACQHDQVHFAARMASNNQDPLS